MRKIANLKIDDREYTVRELTVRDVWNLQNAQDQNGSEVERFLGLACPELTVERAMDMAPSDLKKLWEMFREVNADFLGVAAHFGLGEMMLDLIRAELARALPSLTGPSVLSSDPATVPAPGPTDGAFS